MLDPSLPEARIEDGIARAEYAVYSANLASAQLHAAIAGTLDDARRSPEMFLGTASANDPDFAERAAAADLAVRLTMSEPAVRAIALDARTLRDRLPRVWVRVTAGEVAPPNARVAAELARSIPDDPEVLARFDAGLESFITILIPARFRVRARALRERVHSVALAERARAATETRGVWIENDLDGMAWLTLRLTADVAHRAYARIDDAARSLARADGDVRTLAQLRGDVAGDLLLGSGADTTSPSVSVAVTVPVMTLLGCDDEPASLEGYGPIDADTARRLAARAPSFTRLLTHPVTGALLDVDRRTYRPPADLKRALEIVDGTCAFPGCGRAARGCDLDHTVAWAEGGVTRAGNLAHLCRHHHRLKHESRWDVRLTNRPAKREHDPLARRVTWTSPTGHERDNDPPPF
ncbi:MAG: DUF222 domain-containing protein [Schumannella sp.]